MANETKLKLAELARHVASELRTANIQAGEAGDAIMNFVECEIEVGFEVEIEASGGVTIWAVQIGAGATQTTTNTVRVKYQAIPGLTMQAQQSTT